MVLKPAVRGKTVPARVARSFPPRAHVPEGFVAVPFEGSEEREPGGQEQQCAVNGQPGVDGPVFCPYPAAQEGDEDGKPESPCDDRCTDGNDDPGVPGKTGEVVAVEGEAGVVERRDGMEGAVPECRGRVAVVGDPEADGQDGRGEPFEDGHDPGNPKKY